jgi:hypothetical protein
MGHPFRVLFKHRLVVPVCFVFAASVLLLPLPLRASGFAHTLGINFVWDIADTKKHFAKAVVPEKDWGEQETEAAVKAWSVRLLSLLGPAIQQDTIAFRDLNFVKLPQPDCLYYQNAIEPREDIALVAVCFYGKEHQVVIIPFFRKGEIDAATLSSYLTDEYGKEISIGGYGAPDNPPGSPTTTPAGMRMWSWRSVILVGLPRKYVFLFEKVPDLPDISAAVVYVDTVQLNALNDDLKDEEKRAKKAARKGL